MKIKSLAYELRRSLKILEWNKGGETKLYLCEFLPSKERGNLSFLLGGVKVKKVFGEKIFSAWNGKSWLPISQAEALEKRVEGNVYYSINEEKWFGLENAAVGVEQALTEILSKGPKFSVTEVSPGFIYSASKFSLESLYLILKIVALIAWLEICKAILIFFSIIN